MARPLRIALGVLGALIYPDRVGGVFVPLHVDDDNGESLVSGP